MTTPEAQAFDPWARETGLPDKVNGYMINNRFGVNEEYAKKVAASAGNDGEVPISFMSDLVAEDGTYLGNISFSVGSGWIPSDDGSSISHPSKNNVVQTSRYGAFQGKVVDEIGVDMRARGIPTNAKVWDGIGFYWTQQKLYTVGGDPKDVLFPEKYIGYLDPVELTNKFNAKGGKPQAGSAATVAAPAAAAAPPAAAPAAPAAAPAAGGEITIPQSVIDAAKSMDVTAFQQACLKNPDVLNVPALITMSMDTGPNGLYERAKAM